MLHVERQLRLVLIPPSLAVAIPVVPAPLLLHFPILVDGDPQRGAPNNGTANGTALRTIGADAAHDVPKPRMLPRAVLER
jgi:hypothetical protein